MWMELRVTQSERKQTQTSTCCLGPFRGNLRGGKINLIYQDWKQIRTCLMGRMEGGACYCLEQGRGTFGIMKLFPNLFWVDGNYRGASHCQNSELNA